MISFKKKYIKFLKPNTDLNINKTFEKKLISELDNYFECKKKKLNLEFGVSASRLLYSVLKNNKSIKNEILVPVIICEKIIESILLSNHQPVFYDLDEKFTINLRNVKDKINNRTYATIVPHFFGNYNEKIFDIKKYLENNNIYLIEDYAQAFGLEKIIHNHQFCGDFILYSFGYGKTLFCPKGGVLIHKNKNITIDKFESYDHDNDINKFLNYQKPQLSFILKRFMVFFFGIRFLNIFLFLFNLINKKKPSFERKNIISYQAMNIINKNIKNAKTQIEKQIYNGQEILKNIKENHIIYTNSVYSKVIISFAEKKKLDIFKKKLYNNGIEFELSFKINDIANSELYKNSKKLTNNCLTIPNRWNLTKEELSKILKTVR